MAYLDAGVRWLLRVYNFAGRRRLGRSLERQDEIVEIFGRFGSLE